MHLGEEESCKENRSCKGGLGRESPERPHGRSAEAAVFERKGRGKTISLGDKKATCQDGEAETKFPLRGIKDQAKLTIYSLNKCY